MSTTHLELAPAADVLSKLLHGASNRGEDRAMDVINRTRRDAALGLGIRELGLPMRLAGDDNE